jgi:MFS transporter, DHA1 family, inner membrane transport protein
VGQYEVAADASRRPEEARRPTLGLLALALGGFAIGTTEFATLGVLPDIASNLHTSIVRAGHLVSLYALGVVVGAPLFTVLGAHLDRKRLLVGLMCIFAACNLASALAPSIGFLVVARFASGLPHGAYFGVGSVMAASLVEPSRRGHAVAMLIGGLTVSNVVGVPLATLLGQHFGWRAVYAVVSVLAALTALSVGRLVPRRPVSGETAIRRELGALKRLHVWLALLTGAIGFGGFFAVYSYVAPIMEHVAGVPRSGIPIVLALFGIGMTVGNFAGGRIADHSVNAAILGGFAATIAVLALFTVAVHQEISAVFVLMLLGVTPSIIVPGLQTRLMDVSADAQSLAAALNHSALNIANSLGAWLGGLVIAAGYGYTSTAWVGVALACGGLTIAAATIVIGRAHKAIGQP